MIEYTPMHSQCPRCGNEWMEYIDGAKIQRCVGGCGIKTHIGGGYSCKVGEYWIRWYDEERGFFIFDHSGKIVYEGHPLDYNISIEQIRLALVFQ